MNAVETKSGMTTYEYVAMSTKWSLEAANKLTAYATMIIQYDRSAHMIALYAPAECKEDSWINLFGAISERLDEIFGGEGSFDKYVEQHIDDIKACYQTIKKLV